MSTNPQSADTSGGASGRVVVGVHGSRSSLRALEHAVRIALDRGWDLEIVTAWPDADDPLIHDVPGRYITARGRAQEAQREALESLDPLMAPRVFTFLVNARPAQALICRGGDADLLVVGAGRPVSELGRSSVAAECVEAAPCAVAVVPDPDAAPSVESGTRPPARRPRHGRGRASRAGAASHA